MMKDFFKLSFLYFILSTPLWAHSGRIHFSELHIPIGHSPGMSNIWTQVGCIKEIDSGFRQIRIETQDQDFWATIKEAGYKTRIFLDRSRDGKKNIYGQFSDFSIGSFVELDFRSHKTPKDASWIKIDDSNNSTPCDE